MTNYNGRLDEILGKVRYAAYYADYHANHTQEHINSIIAEHVAEQKQAITSLTKELVAEAKPKENKNYYTTNPVEKGRKMGYNQAIKEFEQNLLKALEEV